MRQLWIALTCIAVLLIPAVCGLVWRKNIGAMRPVWMGMLGFCCFAGMIEPLFVALCLTSLGAVSAWLNASIFRLILFSCLCAGGFEECGRYWIYGAGLPHCEGRLVPVGYAIGHFGVEILFLTVYPLLSRAPEVFGAAEAGIAVYERLVACAGHTALSVLVWEVFCTKKKGKLLFPILVHAACDAPLGMLKYGVLGRGAAETLFGVFVAVLCAVALQYWRRMPPGAIIRE